MQLLEVSGRPVGSPCGAELREGPSGPADAAAQAGLAECPRERVPSAMRGPPGSSSRAAGATGAAAVPTVTQFSLGRGSGLVLSPVLAPRGWKAGGWASHGKEFWVSGGGPSG